MTGKRLLLNVIIKKLSSFQGIHEKQRKWRQKLIPNTSKTVVGTKK